MFRAVEVLRGQQEVLVRTTDGLLSRMLTPRGLADWWHAYSEPFLVVEELERALRDMLRPFEGDRLQLATAVAKVEELNPLHYQQAYLKLRTDIPALADLDVNVVSGVLVSFAQQRNKLMHFRLDDRASLAADLRRFREIHGRIRRVVLAT